MAVSSLCQSIQFFHSKICRENGKGASFSGDIVMQHNKKGNFVIINREKRSALQNSAFIEDVYSDSDDDSEAENVSRNQWDETLPNDLSTLANFTLSNGNETAYCDAIDENDLTNGSSVVNSESNALVDDSVIVIDDD